LETTANGARAVTRSALGVGFDPSEHSHDLLAGMWVERQAVDQVGRHLTAGLMEESVSQLVALGLVCSRGPTKDITCRGRKPEKQVTQLSVDHS
jgi:hypothetical protein